jgi:alpha-mannosidase
MQTIFLTPHTHYDAAWAFTKEEYFKINLRILEEAVQLMETSEFKFCLEQTFLLKYIEDEDPDLFNRLKKMIEAKKLEIVDGQYLMVDTMLTSGEVLIRNICLGKRYCKEKFGIDVPVAWAADNFGMNAQLPQIYRKTGYKWLAFRRGAPVNIRESEFLWKGLDGTTIISHWFPRGYRAGLDIGEWEETFIDLNKFASTFCILMPSGSGSMPLQPEIISALKKWNQDHPTIEMKMATPREFFEAWENCGKTVETAEGELYDDELVNVFPQVCSSRIWIIQKSRECESLYINAEKFATIAWLLGARYPANELREACEKLSYIAFHDIITGCGVDEIYTEVEEILINLKYELSEILADSQRYISEKITTNGNSVVIFNPLSFRTKNCVEINPIPAETEIKTDKARSTTKCIVTDLPPLGYKVLKSTSQEDESINMMSIKGNEIETAFFKLEVDENNGVITVLDKVGKQLLKGNEIVIEDEVGDLYYHRSRFSPELIKSESGEGFQYGSFKPKSFRIEEDTSRVKLIFENEYYCLTWPYRLKQRFPPMMYKYKTLDITKEVVVYKEIPRIDFCTKVDNQYPNIRLRVKFDTGIERKLYFRETQFGVTSEPTDHLYKVFEHWESEPSKIPNFMNWFDISDGIRGITFMNRGLPAVEIDKENVYITLLRSVSGLSADGTAGPLVPTPDALELKSYKFEYAVQLHDGDWREAEVYKTAQEFQNLPVAIQANGKGDLASEFSFLEISPSNLILSALKKAEESDEVILRFFETKGVATKASIVFFRNIKKVTQVNLLEEEEKEIPFNGCNIELEVKPFEIVNLKLKL